MDKTLITTNATNQVYLHSSHHLHLVLLMLLEFSNDHVLELVKQGCIQTAHMHTMTFEPEL